MLCQAQDSEEQRRQEQQQRFKQLNTARIEAWRQQHKGNIRGMLGSLQTVLWEGSGWTPLGIGDLLEPIQVGVCCGRLAWLQMGSNWYEDFFEGVQWWGLKVIWRSAKGVGARAP